MSGRAQGYFAEKWTADALISSVGGAVEKSMMAKALSKWVSLGVIKEEEGGELVLLEVQEEGGVKPSISRQGTFVARLLPNQLVYKRAAVVEEAPSVMTVEQQQAEQMKVYWRVCAGSHLSLVLI